MKRQSEFPLATIKSKQCNKVSWLKWECEVEKGGKRRQKGEKKENDEKIKVFQWIAENEKEFLSTGNDITRVGSEREKIIRE